MYRAFHFAIDGLFKYPLYKAEHYARAVERGNGQQVEYRQIYAYKRGDLQREKPTVTD